MAAARRLPSHDTHMGQRCVLQSIIQIYHSGRDGGKKTKQKQNNTWPDVDHKDTTLENKRKIFQISWHKCVDLYGSKGQGQHSSFNKRLKEFDMST